MRMKLGVSMARAEPAGRFEISDWIVDPSADEICPRGADTATKLEPRMTRLLVCLAESAGQVVSSQRLLEEVWPDVVVGPASIYQSISQLRKILGDTETPPKYIGTVPRKGYRLVVPVRWINDATPEPAAALPAAVEEPPPPPPGSDRRMGRDRRRRPRRRLASTTTVVLVLAIAVVMLTGLYFFGGNLSFTPFHGPPSIAVLPFVDMTTEQRDQTFCDGLSEELSSWLAQVPTLRVVARTSAFSFRGKSEDVRKIGKELDASHVLEGSVRRTGSQVRVTAQLIDSANGFPIWSTSIDRPFTDVVGIQEEIARSVTEALEVRLSRDAANRLRARQPANSRGYELYLSARQHERERTLASNRLAIELYTEAVRLDPSFALAYTGLASATLNEQYLTTLRIADVEQPVENFLAQAFKLNPELPEAFITRGALRTDQGRLDEALKDLNRAVQLNPNAAGAFAALGRVYRYRGQGRDALSSFDHAMKLDPLDFMLHAERCMELQSLARFDEAALACGRARALENRGAWGLTVTAWLAFSQGKLDEGITWLNRALIVNPDDPDLLEVRGEFALQLGLTDMARKSFETGRKASQDAARFDAGLANIVYVEQGEAALRAYLSNIKINASTRPDILFAAARLYQIANDPVAAKAVIDRALAAPGFTAQRLTDPWLVRWGSSEGLDVAFAYERVGARAEAQKRRREVTALLDQLERNGHSGYGLQLLRAEIFAADGKLDAAMASLKRAVDLGWRAAFWTQHEPQFAALWPRADFKALMQSLTRTNDLMRAKLQESSAGVSQ
jgi:TolB-like protein/DNA-binding winged helix-turn-helix (wHTH) protein/Flp pilus assembly protein TadD